MVSVSVAPELASPIVTPENGFTAASDVVGCPATAPAIVGAEALVPVVTKVLA